MTITSDLPPDVADTLARKAARQGRDAAGLVRHLAEREAQSVAEREAAATAVWDPPALTAWDALLDSFAAGEAPDHRETVAALAQALNDDRPGKP